MQYPIRRTMLAVCMSIAGVAFATKSVTPKQQPEACTTISVGTTTNIAPAPAPMPAVATTEASQELYNEMDLAAKGMNEEVFETAFKGFTRLSEQGKISNESVITI